MITAASILTEFSEYRISIADPASTVRELADVLLRIREQINNLEPQNIQLLSGGFLTPVQFAYRQQETFRFLSLWVTYAQEAIRLGCEPSDELQGLIDSEVIRIKLNQKAQEFSEPAWDDEFIARQKESFERGEGFDVRKHLATILG